MLRLCGALLLLLGVRAVGPKFFGREQMRIYWNKSEFIAGKRSKSIEFYGRFCEWTSTCKNRLAEFKFTSSDKYCFCFFDSIDEKGFLLWYLWAKCFVDYNNFVILRGFWASQKKKKTSLFNLMGPENVEIYRDMKKT